MKCPLLTIGFNASMLNEVAPAVDCIKEECAWWNEYSEECAVKMGQVNLGSIADSLDVIMETMPHEGQFRK